MPRLRPHFATAILALALGLSPVLVAAGAYETVVVAPAKTSIYIGRVTLTPTILRRETGTRYTAAYKARIFPYFFYNESGLLWIDFSDEQLARLERGERVPFSGRAENSTHAERRIEGSVTPSSPAARDGAIKVRIFVTPKIELIFNTTYRFADE